MTPRTYATFDPQWAPAGATLERSNTVARVGAGGAHTLVSQFTKAAGIWTCEFMAYGTLGTGADLRVGFAWGSPVDPFVVGEDVSYGDAMSIAYRMTGQLRSGGATIGTAQPWGLGDVITLRIDLDDKQLGIFKNGARVAQVVIPLGVGYSGAPACTLAAGTASGGVVPELRMYYNSGSARLEHLPGGNGAWYEVAAGIGLHRVADRHYRDPSQPFEAWAAGLGNTSLAVTQAVTFWPWGRAQPRAQGTLRLDNADGRFDRLIEQDVRDATVRIRTLGEGQPLASAREAAALIIDSVRAPDDASVTITLRDASAALAVPVQRRQFLPTVDAPQVGKPWPYIVGAVRSLPLTCIDAAKQVYAINDGRIAGVGSIRDRGARFAPSLGDYILGADGPGTVTLASIAQGKVTADVSSVGGTTPTPPTDLLAGKGKFTTPGDWSLGTFMGVTYSIQTTGVRRLQGVANGTAYWSGIKLPGFNAVAGRTYMVRLTMDHLLDRKVRDYTNGAPYASVQLCFSASAANTAPGAHNRFGNIVIYTPGSRGVAGGYSAAFDQATQPIAILGTAQQTGPLWLGFTSSENGDSFAVREIVIWELSTHELDDESLIPASAHHAVRDLLERALGWGADRVAYEDLIAIDAATGYAGVGLASLPDAPLSAEQALQLVCDAYCLGTWQDADGRLRFARLVDPASRPADVVIEARGLLGPPSIELDLAPGLTTQIGARKNWMPLGESEMVSDDVGLPMTLDGGTI